MYKMTVEFNGIEDIQMFIDDFMKRNIVEQIKEVPKPVAVKEKEVAKQEPAKVEKPKAIKAADYLTVREAAKKYNTSHQLIRYYVKNKNIPTILSGKVSKINAIELDKYMKSSKTGSFIKPKEKVVSEFEIWKRKQFEIMDTKKLDHGKTCSTIFSYLTKVYGIAWK